MKVIIAGSRGITDYGLVDHAIEQSPFEFQIDEIVSGGALGVDSLGEDYASEHGVDLIIFPPNWKKYGKAAGVLRNTRMAEYADALIAVWDGKSKGTEHMIKTMNHMGKPVYVYECKLMN